MYVIKAGTISLFEINLSWQGLLWKRAPGNVFLIVDGRRYLRAVQNKDNLLLDCSEREFNEKWFDYFRVDSDHEEELAVLSSVGGVVSKHSSKSSGIRMLKQDPFQAFVFSSLVSFHDGDYMSATRDLRILNNEFGEKIKRALGDSGVVSFSLFPSPDMIAEKEWRCKVALGGEIGLNVFGIVRDVYDGWIDPETAMSDDDVPQCCRGCAIDLLKLYRDGELSYVPRNDDVMRFMKHRYDVDIDIWSDWFLRGHENLSGLAYQHANLYMMEVARHGAR